MHLFVVVLGGRSRGCHIEQHDVRFVAGASIDHTLPELRRQWFGLRRGLHLDSWMRVEQVEGWRVELRREPFNNPQKLWFVNLGAYDPGSMAELHAFGLFVAVSAASAKARAKRHLLVGAAQQHKDDLHALEAVGALSGIAAAPGRADRGAARRHQTAHRAAPVMTDATGATAAPAVDDVLAVTQLGDWQVHLIPPEAEAPAAQTAWQPLRPDWFGYRRIDRADGASDG